MDDSHAGAPRDRRIYLLIGPKGAGKTYLGTLVAQHTNITFLAVEPLWLALPPGADGWAVVEARIAALFQTHPKVMLETLGAGPAGEQFVARLADQYHVTYIRVAADAEQCLSRVATRDRTQHLPVSLEQVRAYNVVAAAVQYPWDLEVVNDGTIPDDAIVAAIAAL